MRRNVSIIVCTRDRPVQLQRCLESLCKLVTPPAEIIVVDNGSTNPTVPSLAYPAPTRFFSQPVTGLSYARNLGVYHARSEIVAFLDDDAVADSNWLESAIKRFEDPSIGCVTGKVLPLGPENIWQTKILSAGWYPDSENGVFFQKNNFNPLIHSAGVGCNFFLRRSFFGKNSFPLFLGAGTPAGGAEDHYLFFVVIESGWRIFYDPGAVVYHEFVSNETQYNRQIARNGISRGAYLTRFLIWERGYRWSAWKYSASRLLDFLRKEPVQASRLHLSHMLLGPFALVRSMWRAAKNQPTALERSKLVAEFAGSSRIC